ncbi:hypothetical protein DYB37_002639 [Aphanomyces astaci]|uniref:Domain of unknown function at the cortex 1 domain-containing protein n=1 Tax=Aphanomyces astaci TaxID=112090 RepID=A0A3R6YYI9_APHAT|nr:hypothetical protein DYB37_002639 [Aphanomyces astaci]
MLQMRTPPLMVAATASKEHIFLVLALAMLLAMLQSMSRYFSLVVMSVLAVGWRTAAHSHALSAPPSDQCSIPPPLNDLQPVEEAHVQGSAEPQAHDDVCVGLEHLRVVDEGSATNRGIAINSATPVPFENDFFQGHVYFLVKTTPPNATWQHLFVGRKRNFWIQVQGKFKRPPRGTIFMGGELPRSVSVGFLARSLARLVSSMMRRLLGTTHVGFGDDEERPHCVFPLFQTVDEMVVTPVGAMPPTLGQAQFGETLVAQQRRKATPLGGETIHVDATYTFQFHTMYADLAKWTIVNVPGMQDVPLRTFFQDEPLHLTCYDLRPTPKHDHAAKQYLFCFSIHWTPPSSSSSISSTAASTSTCSPPPPHHIITPSATASVDSPSVTRPTSPLPLCIPYWLERLDRNKNRVVVYLLRDQPRDREPESSPLRQLHELPAKMLRSRFSPLSQIHATSKLMRYDAIDSQRLVVQAHSSLLHEVPATPFAWVPASASSLGVTFHNRQANVVLQQQVVRAMSESQLRQEYLVLTHNALQLYRTFSSTSCVQVSLENIVAVSPWTLPLGEGTALAHGLHIHTNGGHVYLCLPSSQAQNEWLRTIAHQRCRQDPSTTKSTANITPHPTKWIDDLVPPSRAGVLNAFRLFRPLKRQTDSTSSHGKDEVVGLDCMEVADAAVRAANALDTQRKRVTELSGDDNGMTWQHDVRAFLEVVALLRWVNVSTLTSYDAKVAFYLNVHRVLQWHVGQLAPTKHAKHAAAYCVGASATPLTLQELEGLALRPRHADVVSASDFRIRLALHMSTSPLPRFDPRRLQYQLNALCTQYFRHTVATDVRRHIVQLPALCLRFRMDYGPQGSGIECARKVLGFLSSTCAEDVQTILLAHDEAPVDIQYVDDAHVVVDGNLVDDK